MAKEALHDGRCCRSPVKSTSPDQIAGNDPNHAITKFIVVNQDRLLGSLSLRKVLVEIDEGLTLFSGCRDGVVRLGHVQLLIRRQVLW